MSYYKKSLGQNFLIDSNIIKKITSITKIAGKNILEIGPGSGNLTEQIIKQKPKSMILIEKDQKLANLLKSKFKNYDNISIINKDFLKLELEKLIKTNTLVFGNLPYNVSSQILIKFLRLKNYPVIFSKLIFMFQKEVGNKIKAKVGEKDYGRLSIITKFKFNVTKCFDISNNCFFPRPKVNSTVLLFKPKKKLNFKIKNIKNLEKITQIFFSGKRKMINKPLKNIFRDSAEIISKLNLNLSMRPENVSENDYYKIVYLFEKINDR